MDSESVLLGMALLCVCALPFAGMYYTNSKKQKAIFQEFLTDAQLSSADISMHEIFNHFVLALSQKSQFFYFFNTDLKHQKVQSVDLNGVKSVHMDKILNTQNKRIEKLNLVFVHRDTSQPPTIIELYNHEFTFQMSGELQLAQRWVASLLPFTNN